MTALPRFADIEVGHRLPPRSFRITRADLVRYAGASGDFNPIHWNERFAREVGLPDVIAHGMYTMALAARAVTDWAGDPGAVVDYSVRFTKPVVVPDDGSGARLTVEGVVAAKLDGGPTRGSDGDPTRGSDGGPAGGRVRVDLTARSGGPDGDKVLGKAQLVVRLR
jgi:acyl dehydratase